MIGQFKIKNMNVFKLTINDSSCFVCLVDDLLHILEEEIMCSDSINISIETLEMSEEEFNELPEFEGFN